MMLIWHLYILAFALQIANRVDAYIAHNVCIKMSKQKLLYETNSIGKETSMYFLTVYSTTWSW